MVLVTSSRLCPGVQSFEDLDFVALGLNRV